MHRADQQIRSFSQQLERQYGFVADPKLPVWQNAVRRIKKLTFADYESRFITNLSCHNLLTNLPLPRGTTQLLGLGLNFCLRSPSISRTTTHTFNRLTADIRRMYHLRDLPDDDNYNPKLYIRSDYKFRETSPAIETAIVNFHNAINTEQLLISQKSKPFRNLTHSQYKLLHFFKDNDQYIVVEGDKNLGPCILERESYIRRGCLDHLSNTRNYQQLDHHTAIIMHRGLMYKLWSWFAKYKDPGENGDLPPFVCLTEAETTFFKRAFRRDTNKLPRFRMICKIHKQPWATRPIVCCSGTLLNDVSRWLDFWLQKLTIHVKSYIKDSQQVLLELSTIRLPPHAKLFTTDANSMYNNIDTTHALRIIRSWLDDLKSQRLLPRGFPIDAVKEAMQLVMCNNIFEWGDLCFKQLLGTAMGTSAAVMWATLYYAIHEQTTILPKHGHNLLYYKRFIDDIFGIWIGNSDDQWHEFCNDIDNFGVLTWDIKDQTLSRSVNFLDLTLTIEGSRIVSRTYQKNLNLYLYLPPASAHPPGVLKGLIFGLIRRYHAQNTHREDYHRMVRLLYHRLLERGWNSLQISPIIQGICRTLSRQPHTPDPPPARESEGKQLFIHLTYHPNDISRQRIRTLYDKHLGNLLSNKLHVERPIIAYSRSTNIGESVTKAKLHQAPGRTASVLMGELREARTPSLTPPTDALPNPTLPPNPNPTPTHQ